MKNKLSLKLRRIVKDRDFELRYVYEEILGIPLPYKDIEIHHVKPHGEGGRDREENLISLDVWTHRTKFHTTMGHADESYQQKALAYLNSEAVQQWRKAHGDELKKIYDSEELSRIKRIRKKCLPAKKDGLPF